MNKTSAIVLLILCSLPLRGDECKGTSGRSRSDAECPNGCRVNVSAAKYPNCTVLLSYNEVRGIHGELVDERTGETLISETFTSLAYWMDIPCGEFAVLNVIAVLDDESCPSGRALYRQFLPCNPTYGCEFFTAPCLRKKYCL